MVRRYSDASTVAGRGLGFQTLDQELRQIPLPVEGRLPPWLAGALLRNGPAKFEVGSRSYNHWFDGLATGKLHATCQGEPFFAFHHVNAYERDGDVILDLCAYDNADIVRAFYRLRPPQRPPVPLCVRGRRRQ